MTLVEYDKNVGVYRHFERLLQDAPASTSWVALADQDDQWYPDKLECLVAVLEEETVMAVSGQARLVDRTGTSLGFTSRRPGDIRHVLLRNEVSGCFSIFRPEVVRKALPFPPSTSIAIHDHWLGSCAVAMGTLRVVNTPLQDYVQHRANVLGEAGKSTFAKEFRTMRTVGGLRQYMNHVSTQRWGWRVIMSRTLLERDMVQREHAFVNHVAEGCISRELLIAILHEVRAGHIRWRAAVALVVGAISFPSSQTK